MQMDKSKAKKKKRSMDQSGANIESKVICVISNKVKDWDMFPVDSIVQIKNYNPIYLLHNSAQYI